MSLGCLAGPKATSLLTSNSHFWMLHVGTNWSNMDMKISETWVWHEFMSSVLVFFHDVIWWFLKQKQSNVWNPQGQPANQISQSILNASGRWVRDASITPVHIHHPLSNITGIHVPTLLVCPPPPMPNQYAWYQCYQQAPTAGKDGMAAKSAKSF